MPEAQCHMAVEVETAPDADRDEVGLPTELHALAAQHRTARWCVGFPH